MKAMILAAGRGERMKPLTDTCPKPLLKVGGLSLIEHHLQKLKSINITDVIINHAWLGEQIEQHLNNGKKWQVNIAYSAEKVGALETAGGIKKALPLLGGSPFLLVNGDVFSDVDFKSFLPFITLKQGYLAHLFLVPNPEHNSRGDFGIAQGQLTEKSAGKASYTYSGIAVFDPAFFDDAPLETFSKLGPLLFSGANNGTISASLLEGNWTDVGTPDRLIELNNAYNNELKTRKTVNKEN